MTSTHPQQVSLQVLIDQAVVFESSGKWLYPLFELEDFLEANPLDISRAEFHDKVIGKAAALLITRFGPRKVHGQVMSRLALPILDAAAIPYGYETLVDRIACQTETLLLKIDDPENAYSLLARRANRF